MINYVIYGSKVFDHFVGSKRDNQVNCSMQYFDALVDKNTNNDIGHSEDVTVIGTFSRDEWFENALEFLKHSIPDRVLFYKHILKTRKLGDNDQLISDIVLCKMTITEYLFLDIVEKNNLNPDQITEMLTYWVKVHNYLRSIWPPKYFQDLYGFESDEKSMEKISVPVDPRIPITNGPTEWKAISRKMKSKGYKINPITVVAKPEKRPIQPVNLVNKLREVKSSHQPPSAKRFKFDGNRFKCFNCGGPHPMRECPEERNDSAIAVNRLKFDKEKIERLKDRVKKQLQLSGTVNTINSSDASENNAREFAYSSCTSSNLNGFHHKPVELLWDTGASAHFVNDKSLLCEYKSEVDNTSFSKGHKDSPLKVLGIGTLLVKLRNGMVVKFSDVRYTNGLTYNLISPLAAIKDGFNPHMHSLELYTDRDYEDCISRLTIDNRTILDGIVITPNHITTINNISLVNSDKAYLAHCRLGHPSVKQHRMLIKAYPDMSISAPLNHGCVACAKANAVKMTPRFSSLDTVTTKPLERIHADVAFTSVKSITGCHMWLTIVDRYSRYVEVFTMAHITEALGNVIAFIKQAEHLLPGVPKCKYVRTDNGSEFMGALSSYCKSRGLKHERTSAYSSFQNGTVERVHRTLRQRAVALLEHASLPEVLWPYALQMAAMYCNFSVSTATLRVPVEDFIGRKVEFPNFRVFGCLMVATAPEKYWDGASSPGVEGAYLGPSLTTKGCLMFEKNSGQIYDVTLVKFFEDRMFFQENPWDPSQIPTRTHGADYTALKPPYRSIVPRNHLLRKTSQRTDPILRPTVKPRLFDFNNLFHDYDAYEEINGLAKASTAQREATLRAGLAAPNASSYDYDGREHSTLIEKNDSSHDYDGRAHSTVPYELHGHTTRVEGQLTNSTPTSDVILEDSDGLESGVLGNDPVEPVLDSSGPVAGIPDDAVEKHDDPLEPLPEASTTQDTHGGVRSREDDSVASRTKRQRRNKPKIVNVVPESTASRGRLICRVNKMCVNLQKQQIQV